MISKIGRVTLWAFVGLLVIIAILPFVLMVSTSIQHTTRLTFGVDLHLLTADNYKNLFAVQGFGQALLRSASVVTIACVLNALVCSLAAYAFAFKRFPGSEALFWIYLATMMIPAQVTMIPMFVLFRQLGLLGTSVSLAIPVVNAFGVFLIRQFMVSIPPSLLEAARIDGASDWRIFCKIILPAIRSVLVALTVFTFLTTWNDFMWPLISISSDQSRTVTLAVSQMTGAFETQYGMVMAGATIAFLVPFSVYVVLQRQFIEGVTSTGVKG
ncbi:carbohydrate ABC transporter permease [Arcanobacterium phocae]|uniref:carbohydrate ABC transporter permease n=1 Tax=Arcanobacterium phocae TaxID=131112 RepID=UPI001C0EE4EB|nr:carbohydrate ABC transporter permease [Arcanobacterium phocae]